MDARRGLSPPAAAPPSSVSNGTTPYQQRGSPEKGILALKSDGSSDSRGSPNAAHESAGITGSFS